MSVDLVNVKTRDGLRLGGIWRKPDSGTSSQLGVDVVVLQHGVGGNFYGAGMFEEYSDAILEKGCAVLRVNNRGHDGMSRAVVGDGVKRIGAAYESMDECTYDWEAWIDFAQAAGYKSIGIWGHSLGARPSPSITWPRKATTGSDAWSRVRRPGSPTLPTPLWGRVRNSNAWLHKPRNASMTAIPRP